MQEQSRNIDYSPHKKKSKNIEKSFIKKICKRKEKQPKPTIVGWVWLWRPSPYSAQETLLYFHSMISPKFYWHPRSEILQVILTYYEKLGEISALYLT